MANTQLVAKIIQIFYRHELQEANKIPKLQAQNPS